MPKENNPFKPSSPVFRGVFAGRISECERIETVLKETKEGNPTHLLIIGERGIGKTSLLLLSKALATKISESGDNNSNFLSVFISLDRRTTIPELARKIRDAIERSLRSFDDVIQFIKDTWKFLKNIEFCGTRLNQKQKEISDAEIFDKFTFSIIDTVKALTESGTSLKKLSTKRDGLVIFIDEADNASRDLDLGTFLKHLSEQLVAEDCNKVLIIMAGLPEIRNVLRDSHESSLRLFEELELFPLTQNDVKTVIRSGLQEANKKNKKEVKITNKALKLIEAYSEGYPHFVQQFGYSSYSVDTDYLIDVKDVDKAAFNEGGAFDIIGDRYYKDMYFNKIKKDSYRQVLKIMSEKWNQWVSRKEIVEKFKGNPTTLNNAIRALSERNVILRRPDKKGEYRLQWAGFAFWINYFARALEERIGEYNGK